MVIKMPIARTSTDTRETIYTLRNAQDMRVTISDRGATLLSWWAPDRHGRLADVLLGYSDAQGYATNSAYFGAIVGRWANRIAGGRFSLDGAEYLVDRNDRGNHLHGGEAGFHLAQWQAQPEEDGLRLTLKSPDGAGGFPGNLQVEVRYRLYDDGRLMIDYEAITDAPTPINLTAHPYFNLNGGSSGIGDHLLWIDADHYLKVDESLIPVEVASVDESAFDFRRPTLIGPRLVWPDPQIAVAGGFDHCYCLRPTGMEGSAALREVATVYDPGSGRKLSVSTTETGLQFYSGNFLGGVKGRQAQPYRIHDGFCLEAQAYPNQINGPNVEAVVLRPGQVYRQTTVYKLAALDCP
ncbi:MAG: aldose epimerase family protein [Pseudomonadota bacterium]